MSKIKEQTGHEPDDRVIEDQSFINSDGHKFNGLTLQPFTIERQWAADAMGLRWGKLPHAIVANFDRNFTYPGMLGDVGMVIWLCSLENPDDVRAARRNPDMAEEQAQAFALENKIASPKQASYWDAYEIFWKMMNEIHASYSEPEGQKKTERGSEKKSNSRQSGRA